LIFPEKWATSDDQIRTDVPMLFKGAYSRRDEGATTLPLVDRKQVAEIGTKAGDGCDDLSKGAYSEMSFGCRAIAEDHPGFGTLEFRWAMGRHKRLRLEVPPLTLGGEGSPPRRCSGRWTSKAKPVRTPSATSGRCTLNVQRYSSDSIGRRRGARRSGGGAPNRRGRPRRTAHACRGRAHEAPHRGGLRAEAICEFGRSERKSFPHETMGGADRGQVERAYAKPWRPVSLGPI